jgi:hypothetical protein
MEREGGREREREREREIEREESNQWSLMVSREIDSRFYQTLLASV